MSVEDVLRAVRRQVDCPVATAFFSALVIGFVTHISAITELIMNWDSAHLKPGSWYLLFQGKWFFAIADQVHGVINVGAITVPLALLFGALAAALLVKVLDIQRPVHAALLGAALITFPSLMNIYAYMSEDIFVLAALLSVAAAFFVRKCRFGFALGVVALTLSIGTYQAYIGFAAAILLILCIKDLFAPDASAKAVLIQAGKYISVLLLSLVAYYIVLQIMLAIMNMDLGDYRNVSGVLSGSALGVSAVWSSVVSTYTQFLSGIWSDLFGTGELQFVLLYRFSAVLMLVFVGMLVIRNRLWQKPPLCVLLVIGLAAFPLAVNAIGVLSLGMEGYLIVVFPFVMCVAFLIMLADMLFQEGDDCRNADDTAGQHAKKKRVSKAGAFAQWSVVCVCICLVFNWYVMTNQGYTRMKVSFDQAYAISMGMVGDITSSEGYNENSEVAIMGLGQGKIVNPGFVKTDVFAQYDVLTGIPSRMFPFITPVGWNAFAADYLGYTFVIADKETCDSIAQSDEYQHMPVFPAKGSTRIIKGIIVVKMHATYEQTTGGSA